MKPACASACVMPVAVAPLRTHTSTRASRSFCTLRTICASCAVFAVSRMLRPRTTRSCSTRRSAGSATRLRAIARSTASAKAHGPPIAAAR
jgi:hypothetical protein